jgi:hypothetical protein
MRFAIDAPSVLDTRKRPVLIHIKAASAVTGAIWI